MPNQNINTFTICAKKLLFEFGTSSFIQSSCKDHKIYCILLCPNTQLNYHFCQLFPSPSLIFSGLLRLSLTVSILTSGSRPPFSCFSKPRTWPTNPPGFGTGHSLLLSRMVSACTCSELTSPSMNFCLFLFRRSSLGTSPSAKARRGTGHGRRCGKPTTRNETASVPVKIDIVARERG